MDNFISASPSGDLITWLSSARAFLTPHKAYGQKRSVNTVDIYAAPVISLPMKLFYLAVGIVLFMGWQVRNEQYIVAKSGLGYALGIVGGSMMLLLLLYPFRKKKRFMRNWGPITYWFRVHMALGIIGPVLVMFHTNFKLGSMNSTVVFASMLLVTGSGFVGQYLYSKIHFGLYGRKITLEGLQRDIENNRNSLAILFSYAPQVQKRLIRFENVVLSPATGILHSIGRLIIIDLWRRWNYFFLIMGLGRTLKVVAKKAGWTAQRHKRLVKVARRQIAVHLTIALKIAEFSFYERLFSLWHVFHFPLFIMLVVTGLIHVIAVHMY